MYTYVIFLGISSASHTHIGHLHTPTICPLPTHPFFGDHTQRRRAEAHLASARKSRSYDRLIWASPTKTSSQQHNVFQRTGFPGTWHSEQFVRLCCVFPMIIRFGLAPQSGSLYRILKLAAPCTIQLDITFFGLGFQSLFSSFDR